MSEVQVLLTRVEVVGKLDFEEAVWTLVISEVGLDVANVSTASNPLGQSIGANEGLSGQTLGFRLALLALLDF